jgi:flagellar biosynthetic protein FliP
MLAMSVETNGAQQDYSVNLQLIIFFTALSLLPSIILMMTSFTRIVIVLSLLRQAIGLQQSPNNQIIIGISLFLSIFVMSDVINDVFDKSIRPFNDKKIGFEKAVDEASRPFKKFMMGQVRDNDLSLFINFAKYQGQINAQDLPMQVLVPAFITSELKTAFQIGFLLFIPFLIIDLVVSSVLMAMGMMMLSPLVISLPFKIMIFVLLDGWQLILGSLAKSFLGSP